MSDSKDTILSFDITSCLLAIMLTVFSSLQLTMIDADILGYNIAKYIITSFGGYSIIPIIKLVILYECITYIKHTRIINIRYIVYIMPALLFSLFAIEGHYFEGVNAIDFFTRGRFYSLECALAFIAYTGIYFILFVVLDMLFTSYRDKLGLKTDNVHSRLMRRFERHPFIISFCALLLFYIPVIIISYPGFISWDSFRQIAQAYNTDSYVPYVNLIDENVKLFNHHPISHTLFIYVCLVLGNAIFKSWNAGIFLYVLIQTIVFALVVAYCCFALITKFKTRPVSVVIILSYFCLHPKFQLYLMVVSKDIIYSSFFLLLLCTLIEIIEEINDKRTIILWCISIVGMMLFRNDGFYIIVPVLVMMIPFTKNRKIPVSSLALAVAFFFVWNSVILPFAHISPGSKREMLSIPFQQTARYVSEYESDMTSEEVAAISAILPYDDLAELYDQDISDPVKSGFNENATSDDMKRYFKVWYNMFKKHPDVYFRATFANKYQIFYPSVVRSDTYSYKYGSDLMIEGNELLAELHTDFHYPERMKSLRTKYENIREIVSCLPILDTISTTYCFILAVVFIAFYELRCAKYKSIAIYILFVMQVAIMIAGPCNGHYIRYTLPIACCLPMLVAICLGYSSAKNISRKHLQDS